MQMRELKQIAEKEVRRYRDNEAYIRGYLDGGGDGDSEAYRQRQRWVWAVERVYEQLSVKEPQKAEFMKRHYLGDGVKRQYCKEPSITEISLALYVSEQTLYRWRDEILLSVAIAAVQAKALLPFSVKESQ